MFSYSSEKTILGMLLANVIREQSVSFPCQMINWVLKCLFNQELTIQLNMYYEYEHLEDLTLFSQI